MLTVSVEQALDSGWLVVAEHARIDPTVRVVGRPGHPVLVGERCLVRSGCVLYWDVVLEQSVSLGHGVVLRDSTLIGAGSSVGTGVCVEGDARIGPNCLVETGTVLTRGIAMGTGVFVGVMVCTTNDREILYRRLGDKSNLKAPVIHDRVRIGSHAVLLPGVVVEADAFVAAGALVTRDVPRGKLVMGMPAAIVGDAP